MAAMSKIAKYKMRRGGEWYANFLLSDGQEGLLRDLLRTSQSARYLQYFLEGEPQATVADYENAVAYDIYMREIENIHGPSKAMAGAAADEHGKQLLEEIAKSPNQMAAGSEGEGEGIEHKNPSTKSSSRKKPERRVPLISLLPSRNPIQLPGQRIQDRQRDKEPLRRNDEEEAAAAVQNEKQGQEASKMANAPGGELECDFGEDGECWLCQLDLHSIGGLD